MKTKGSRCAFCGTGICPRRAVVAAGLVEMALARLLPMGEAMASIERMSEVSMLLEGASAILSPEREDDG